VGKKNKSSQRRYKPNGPMQAAGNPERRESHSYKQFQAANNLPDRHSIFSTWGWGETIGLLGVVAVAMAGAVTYGQYAVGRKQLTLQRATVLVTSVTHKKVAVGPIQLGETISLSLALQNTGDALATDVCSGSFFGVYSDWPKYTPETYKTSERKVREECSSNVIPRDGSFRFLVDADAPLSAAQWQQLQNSTGRYMAYGVVRYKDGFGAERVTIWCRAIDYTSRRISTCPTHNRNDD
jgi:hypothetical protein